MLVLAVVLLLVEWGGWGTAEPAAASGGRPRKPKPPVPAPLPATVPDVTPAPSVHDAIDPNTGAIVEVYEPPEPTELPAVEVA